MSLVAREALRATARAAGMVGKDGLWRGRRRLGGTESKNWRKESRAQSEEKRTGLKTRHYKERRGGFQEVPEVARLIQSIVWEPEYGNSWGEVESRFRTGFHQI